MTCLGDRAELEHAPAELRRESRSDERCGGARERNDALRVGGVGSGVAEKEEGG